MNGGRCQGSTAPGAVCLIKSQSPFAPPTDFATQQTALDAITAAVRRELSDAGYGSEATVEGRLIAASPEESGYCHMNQYRMVMIVKRVLAYSAVLDEAGHARQRQHAARPIPRGRLDYDSDIPFEPGEEFR
jgi:hypothetical protein